MIFVVCGISVKLCMSVKIELEMTNEENGEGGGEELVDAAFIERVNLKCNVSVLVVLL